jgi:hypothetical protein
MGNYPAILNIRNTTMACEIIFKNTLNMCSRRIKAQTRQSVTLKNLAGALESKMNITNMEDETLNTSCTGVAGAVFHLDELKGEFKMPRINLA